jgi:hypothetical protein
MKSCSVNIISIFLLFTALNDSALNKEKIPVTSSSYFPVNNSIELIYNSSFGETITKYSQDGEFIISLSEADDFKYRQILKIEKDGIYIKETYQLLKLFLFINREEETTYGNLFLRFPLPLSPGMEWEWEGDEYSDGDTNIVKVTGKVFDKDFIKTEAGTFEAIKIESIVESADNSKNRVTEWYAEGIGLIKAKIIIEGGGLMGFLRDLLGYGTIEFELTEIRKL